MSGHIVLRRVPGLVYIAAHAHPLLFDVFNPINNLNLSHVIHSLTFAHDHPGSRWFSNLPNSQHFDTLAGTKRITKWSAEDNNLPDESCPMSSRVEGGVSVRVLRVEAVELISSACQRLCVALLLLSVEGIKWPGELYESNERTEVAIGSSVMMQASKSVN